MLTEEQKRMVEENHNLIYWYCHKYNLDIEEYYGLFAIELCRAVQLYDPTKSKITTYIIKAFWNKHVNWEKGNTEPSLSQLREMSRLSGVPMDFIFVPDKSN